ncbi:hypothetical protein BaRGS_00011204, partial [Batillaria attramentaria]
MVFLHTTTTPQDKKDGDSRTEWPACVSHVQLGDYRSEKRGRVSPRVERGHPSVLSDLVIFNTDLPVGHAALGRLATTPYTHVQCTPLMALSPGLVPQ